MKIAFVKQKYVPFGGGEGYLAGLLDGCAEKGHEVHLITTEWENGQKFPFQVQEARLSKISRRSRVTSFAASVADIVGRNSFDVVFSLERTVSQNIWRAGDCVYPKWLSQRALFDPLMIRLFNRLSGGQRAVVEMERRCVAGTPFIIANSEMIRSDLHEVYGNMGASIEVIYNGYDPFRFSLEGRGKDRTDIRHELGLSESDQVVLFAASGWRRKGLLELLRSLHGLPEVMLLVLGRDETARWKRLARNAGVERQVRFVAPRRDIHRFYHAVDLTILPSWYDSFGFVVLESMACGTPVVVSRYAGAHELVQRGINGITIGRPDSIDEMREAIVQALEIRSPDAVAASVSAYTLENNVRKTLDVIERAAA
jgi:UDP-glucose:(heptosyl)LPS alpha-1,3-glucosyltransferase